MLADKRLLPRETINYVPNILALTIIGKNPEKYGFLIEPEDPMETERVAVDKATRVIAEADQCAIGRPANFNAHVADDHA